MKSATPDWNKLPPYALEGRFVRMEPLSHTHLPDLEKNYKPEILRHYPRGYGTAKEFVLENFENAALGLMVPYAIVLAQTGEAVGCSEYSDLSPANLRLEIGGTWIAPRFQGTAVNPEAKLLMLEQAFTRYACQRVEFKTDSLNLQSQAALEKLGAVREGTLRNHIRRADGTRRHSVYFSVISEEWPELREKLRKRVELSGPPIGVN